MENFLFILQKTKFAVSACLFIFALTLGQKIPAYFWDRGEESRRLEEAEEQNGKLCKQPCEVTCDDTSNSSRLKQTLLF